MTKRLISSGSAFEALAGYSRAVVDGDWIHVSGTTGFDYSTMTIADDLLVQTRQAFANISAALKQADATLDNVIRVTYYMAEREYFDKAAPVFGEYFATARPAATAVVCGLVDARMKIEIEVTARKGA